MLWWEGALELEQALHWNLIFSCADCSIHWAITISIYQLKSHLTNTIPLILWILLFPQVFSKRKVKPTVNLASTTPFCQVDIIYLGATNISRWHLVGRYSHCVILRCVRLHLGISIKELFARYIGEGYERDLIGIYKVLHHNINDVLGWIKFSICLPAQMRHFNEVHKFSSSMEIISSSSVVWSGINNVGSIFDLMRRSNP